MSRFKSVIELFQSQVASNGAQIAVEASGGGADESLDYQELDRRSNNVAARLMLGVVRDEIVAVLSSRRPEMIVAILGILKAGAAYLSLDASYPAHRLEFMLKDSTPKLLLNTSKEDVPFETVCDVRKLDEMQDGSADFDGHIVECVGEDLAYVIYTSGSTGTPKGVLLEHAGLSEMAIAHAEIFGVGPGSRVLQFSSLSFDAAVHEIFMTLCSGGTLCLANSRDLIPGRELVQLLNDRRITNVLLPPSALTTMPDDPLPCLRTLISGGEACNRQIVNRWAPGRDFFNAYGPTEGTVTATIQKVDRNIESDPPIGSARKYASVYVLDEDRQKVAAGETGELYVGGRGVARGYLNRNELTGDHFISDPFCEADTTNGRMYRTGDLVREIDGGALQFIGRTDRQIKVRGFRVELGEIESTLNEHEMVRQSAAKLVEFGEGDSRIVAFYIPTDRKPSIDESSTLTDSIRSWLSSRLPAQSIPSRFVPLDKLPLTENGKINYQMLSVPEANASSAPRAEDSVRSGESDMSSTSMTTLETSIHDAWCDQIGLDSEELDIDDHFIEVGGDSLLAAHIALRLEAIGVTVGTQDILDHPTVRKLAVFLDGKG